MLKYRWCPLRLIPNQSSLIIFIIFGLAQIFFRALAHVFPRGSLDWQQPHLRFTSFFRTDHRSPSTLILAAMQRPGFHNCHDTPVQKAIFQTIIQIFIYIYIQAYLYIYIYKYIYLYTNLYIIHHNSIYLSY